MATPDPTNAIPSSGDEELSVEELEDVAGGQNGTNSGCTINTNCATACVDPDSQTKN